MGKSITYGSIVFTPAYPTLCQEFCMEPLPTPPESPVADPSPPLYMQQVGGILCRHFSMRLIQPIRSNQSIAHSRPEGSPLISSWIQQQCSALGNPRDTYDFNCRNHHLLPMRMMASTSWSLLHPPRRACTWFLSLPQEQRVLLPMELDSQTRTKQKSQCHHGGMMTHNAHCQTRFKTEVNFHAWPHWPSRSAVAWRVPRLLDHTQLACVCAFLKEGQH